MRRLAIHPDLAGELWCQHWTARPPRLPQLNVCPATDPQGANRQLALADLLDG